MTNPKDIQGEKKPPLHLIPLNAKIVFALAMKNGAEKYGPYNWRELEIQASAYIVAAQRHIDLWYDCSEENAKDSGVHHLGHAMATLGILYDALVNEQLIDDRPTPSKASKLMDQHTVDNKIPKLGEALPLPEPDLSPEKRMKEWTNVEKCSDPVVPLLDPSLARFYQTTSNVEGTIIGKDDPRVASIEVPSFGELPILTELPGGGTKISFPPGFDVDDPRSFDIDAPGWGDAKLTGQITPEPDRDNVIEEALKRWDALEVEDEDGWKRRLFRRSVIRKLDETLGVDLDFMAPEDRRRSAPESVFLKSIQAGHSDRALRAFLDELFGESTPYKGVRAIVDDDPFYYIYHEPRSHGSPEKTEFVSSTDRNADIILGEILPSHVMAEGAVVEESTVKRQSLEAVRTQVDS